MINSYSDGRKYVKDLTNESRDQCDRLGVPMGYDNLGNPMPLGHNDQRDAFRHAYTSAIVAFEQGEYMSQILGGLNEIYGEVMHDQSDEELNMDLWNNRVGREIGENATSRENIAQMVYNALQSGQLITYLSDTRGWEGLTYGPFKLPDETDDNLFEQLRHLFNIAEITRSPVALDLDGDGIETTALADGPHFDHDGNGFDEQTGWIKSDDDLLVRDINNDGIINDGKELFGDQTILSNGQKANNGFQALADLDNNHDGKIDSNDAAFSQLKVWQDADGDGYSSADELKSLSDAGITSINTGYTSTNITDENGNTIKANGTFTFTDGTTGNAADVWFKTDNMYTIAEEWLDVPEDITALPDLQDVYGKHQAMVHDKKMEMTYV